MSKPTHYVQVEGVNLYPSIYDTGQLSIIRGSSVLLKLAIEVLDAKPESTAKNLLKQIANSDRIRRFELPNPTEIPLKAISSGASSGLYEVETDNPAILVQAIAQYLSDHRYLRCFTFTIVYEPYQPDFKTVKERLVAKTRLQQLRQLSLAPQAMDSDNAEPCVLNGILPADQGMDYPPKGLKNQKISPACQDRFLFGRHFRNALYWAEIYALKTEEKPQGVPLDGQGLDLDGLLEYLKISPASTEEEKFSKSFKSIADGQEYPNLNNKIAVLYFDGNGFGKIQKTLVNSAEDQTEFDRTIKTYQRTFLAHLLTEWKQAFKSDSLPLETLLWGGDEMLFVVPASKGMELLQRFYQCNKDWRFKSEPLTYAGGLVFCHYKTPIDRIKKLAKDLAEAVKDRKNLGDGNYFDYMALESIDYPAESLSDFFTKRFGLLGICRYPLQPSLDWPEAKARIAAQLDATPKGQAYAIARASLERGDPPAPAAFFNLLLRFEQLQADSTLVSDLENLLWRDVLRPPAYTGTCLRWQWLHLVELWDYLAPEAEAQKDNRHG